MCVCGVCVSIQVTSFITIITCVQMCQASMYVCVCNYSNSHCTIITANRSKGPFHHVKAVYVIEHWTVCVLAGESFVNLTSLTLQLLPHHCPLLTAAERRHFLMLALPPHILLGLVYRDH